MYIHANNKIIIIGKRFVTKTILYILSLLSILKGPFLALLFLFYLRTPRANVVKCSNECILIIKVLKSFFVSEYYFKYFLKKI